MMKENDDCPRYEIIIILYRFCCFITNTFLSTISQIYLLNLVVRNIHGWIGTRIECAWFVRVRLLHTSDFKNMEIRKPRLPNGNRYRLILSKI